MYIVFTFIIKHDIYISKYLHFNSDTSKVMFISSRQNHIFYNLIQTFRNSVTKSCSTGKLQGVTVYNVLSWSDHIGTVIKEYNTNLNILSRIKV